MNPRKGWAAFVGISATALLAVGACQMANTASTPHAGQQPNTTASPASDHSNESATLAEGPRGPGPGLELRNLRSLGVSAVGRQRVGYDVRWPTGSFPGVYRCTWEVFSGSERMGSFTDVVVALSEQVGVSVEVPVTAPGNSFQVRCGDRLDVGSPYGYSLSGIRIEEVEVVSPSQGLATVAFRGSWAGPGHAGPMLCTWDFLDGSGNMLHSNRRVLFAADGAVPESSFTVSAEIFGTVQPVEARATCEPFVG